MRLTGSEPIVGTRGLRVQDFWRWAYSDVLVNTNRSILAEFLVGTALGVVDGVRKEWDAYDLKYRDHPIEVKASAYVQSWAQQRPSAIKFDIAKKFPWFAVTNTYGKELIRTSTLYVFCLLTESDRASANPLDTLQWEFYVVPTQMIDEQFGDAKSLSLRSVQALATASTYAFLKSDVDRAIIDFS